MPGVKRGSSAPDGRERSRARAEELTSPAPPPARTVSTSLKSAPASPLASQSKPASIKPSSAPSKPPAPAPSLGKHQLSPAAEATIARLRKSSPAAKMFAQLRRADETGVAVDEDAYEKWECSSGGEEDEPPPRERLHTRSTAGELYHVLATALAEAQREQDAVGTLKEVAEFYTCHGGLEWRYERRVAWDGDTRFRFVRGSFGRFFANSVTERHMRDKYGADVVLFFPTMMENLRALGGGDDSHEYHGDLDIFVISSAADVRRRAGAIAAWVRVCVASLEAIPADPLAGSSASLRNQIMNSCVDMAKRYRDEGRISAAQYGVAFRHITNMPWWGGEKRLPLPKSLSQVVKTVASAWKTPGGWMRLCNEWFDEEE